MFPSRRAERQQTSTCSVISGNAEKCEAQRWKSCGISNGTLTRLRVPSSTLCDRPRLSLRRPVPFHNMLNCTSAESPGAVGGSALQEPVLRIVYIFVFQCEMCMRDLYAYFRPHAPELDFQLTCPCGWAGTRRGAQARKVICQHADAPLPKP